MLKLQTFDYIDYTVNWIMIRKWNIISCSYMSALKFTKVMCYKCTTLSVVIATDSSYKSDKLVYVHAIRHISSWLNCDVLTGLFQVCCSAIQCISGHWFCSKPLKLVAMHGQLGNIYLLPFYKLVCHNCMRTVRGYIFQVLCVQSGPSSGATWIKLGHWAKVRNFCFLHFVSYFFKEHIQLLKSIIVARAKI